MILDFCNLSWKGSTTFPLFGFAKTVRHERHIDKSEILRHERHIDKSKNNPSIPLWLIQIFFWYISNLEYIVSCSANGLFQWQVLTRRKHSVDGATTHSSGMLYFFSFILILVGYGYLMYKCFQHYKTLVCTMLRKSG